MSILPALTSILALVMAIALLDQWRERRQPFQLVWAIGMAFYGIAAGCEAIAAAAGWSEPLYRTWYLTGAVLTAGWLGLGTALLLSKTRFGYAVAISIFLAGLFTLLTQAKYHYEGAGSTPILYFIGAGLLALAIAVETYFQNERWPVFMAVGVIAASLLALFLTITATLSQPYLIDPVTGQPIADLFPGSLRLLTPFLNITGGFALAFGALFSAYMFMPKRRVLPYSLDPNQPGDHFLFNLLIAPVAILVNLFASLPSAGRALLAGQLHSRVPATILICVGAFIPTVTDSLNRAGSTELFQVGKFLGVVFLFTGFLVSIETFREIRVPFTSIKIRTARREHELVQDGAAAATTVEPAEAATAEAPGA